MFLANSRYAKLATVETTLATGERVVALKLRRLTPVSGERRTVRAGDRLDIIAQAQFGDGTQFWRIADANTALDSRTLMADAGSPTPAGAAAATIVVPKG